MTSTQHTIDDVGAATLLRRLRATRQLVARIAALEGVDDQLAALAAAALDLTGFGCGQVYTYEDGLWTGHGGAQCPDFAGCTVCNTDPRFTAYADRTVVLDRVSSPGREVLADAPARLAKVLVTPVPVGPDQHTVLVLRSDDPGATVDATTLELVQVLTAQSAIAVEHGRALEAQRRHHDELRRVAERSQEFVRVLSHDLRGPLGTISATAATLRQHRGQLARGDVDELLGGAQRQALRLARLVEDVALAVLGDDQELALTIEPVAIVDLLREEVARARARGLSGRLEVHVDPHLVGALDRGRGAQVLQHLVDNACTHGSAGTPVRVVVHADAAHVAIDVSNTGAPIPQDVREDIFAKFDRGADVGPDAPGAGLGLYVARRFARAMGGDVTLRDDAPGVTTFRFHVPVATDEHLAHRTSGRADRDRLELVS